MNDTLKEIWNYVLSIILLICGIIFLTMFLKSAGRAAESGLNERQPIEMLYGSILLIVTAILALPIFARKLQKGLAWGLGALAVLCAGFLIYSLVNTIQEEMDYRAEFKEYNDVTKQRLLDIRTAQEAYSEYNGRYTDDWDSLITFIKTPVIPKEYKSGEPIPRRISKEDTIRNGTVEEYAQRGLVIKRTDLDSVAGLLGISKDRLTEMIVKDQVPYIIRDTTYVSLYDDQFSPAKRERKNLPPIDIDKIAYNSHPRSGEKFLIKVGVIETGEVGGLKSPVIEVTDRTPFGREGVKREALMFGSMEEVKTDGNWARE